LFAANAQMEIWEEYFSSYNKTINAENQRAAGTDYADIESPIAETLETFLKTDYLAHLGGNSYSMPTLATVGNDSYYLLKLLCHTKKLTSGLTTAAGSSTLVSSTATFLSDGLTAGDIVVNGNTGAVSTITNVVSNTLITLSSNIFTASGQIYNIYSSEAKEADKVSVGKITMLNASSLTTPTEFYPSYTLEEQTIKLFPKTIDAKGKIEAVYFRYPKTPKWTYISLVSGEPAFDQSQPDYQDFELPTEDGFKLVTKILEYCGISIREMEVTQFGMAQQAHEQPTFSIQQ
jgi:hypothetical protein